MSQTIRQATDAQLLAHHARLELGFEFFPSLTTAMDLHEVEAELKRRGIGGRWITRPGGRSGGARRNDGRRGARLAARGTDVLLGYYVPDHRWDDKSLVFNTKGREEDR